MDEKKLILLDKEEEDRIKYSFNQPSSDLYNILKYDKIKKALLSDVLIIQGSSKNLINIVSSLPFHSFVFFELCPDCMPNIEILKPLLDTNCVFPILLKGYQNCPESFVSELLKYPHMTIVEYMTLRFHLLGNLSEQVACPHCVEESIADDITSFSMSCTKDDDKDHFLNLIHYILDMLAPFSSLDDELLIVLKGILKQCNLDKLSAFLEVGSLIGRIKTAAAFNSPLSISSNISRVDDFEKYVPQDLNDIMQFSDDIIIKGLELDIPTNLKLVKYIDIIMNNRNNIKKITKHIINKASKNNYTKDANSSLLINEIANINEKIRMVQKSRKYKLYKIGTDILSANKGLISSLACATLMGIYGNLVACGMSASAGIAGKLFKSNNKINSVINSINAGKPIQELRELILELIEPPLRGILSIYFWKDLKIIQAMRIREQINNLP